jgi:hypothetical protein
MRKLSRKELFDMNHYLTVGDLKKFLRDNPDITDDAPVVVERIQDIYFKDNGWGVYLKEGDSYYWKSKLNEDMKEEIERRKRGEEPEYSMEDPSLYIEEPSEKDMNQYIPTWCCVKYPNENILFIDLHY